MKKSSNNKTSSKVKEVYKFKLRTSRYLYTLQVSNKDKADKVKVSLGENKVEEI